jgi:8-oxo-dGTP pyrophosphatase MutT (NUDIX family)
MNLLATIGTIDESIAYTDRPTVKVVITKNDDILLLNNGLLPGGGIDAAESDLEAISRELQEELGATVTNIHKIGEVIQYRNLLGKRYIVKGYTAKLESIDGPTNPQDIGESQFAKNWLTLDKALELLSESIEVAKSKPMNNDANQGRLYNLMSSYELLTRLK